MEEDDIFYGEDKDEIEDIEDEFKEDTEED